MLRLTLLCTNLDILFYLDAWQVHIESLRYNISSYELTTQQVLLSVTSLYINSMIAGEVSCWTMDRRSSYSKHGAR